MASTLPRLQELAASGMTPEEVGGKARHLALLCAAGLPVPDGFVVPAAAIRGSDTMDEVRAAAAGLGPVLAVRSSSPVEDRAEGAAPGLFSSRLDIRPEEIERAVLDVVASGESPAVRAYLARRGEAGAELSVIVQRQVGGQAGVMYTRAPGERDEVWIEAGADRAATAIARRSGAVVSRDPDFPLGDAALAELVRLGLAAERAIAAEARGADVEWVADGESLWLVQARPIRPAVSRPDRAVSRDELAFSRGDPHTVWQWDAAHNPDPLSPAQAGLVDWVADLSPSPLRVVDGYLYVGSRAEPEAITRDAAALQELFAEVQRDIERALAPVEVQSVPDLGAALAAYRTVYAAYMGRLTPALASARAALRAEGVPLPPPESAVGRAARAGDRQALAALAPVWDVAAPTFGELGLDGAATEGGTARSVRAQPRHAGGASQAEGPAEPGREASRQTEPRQPAARLAASVRAIGEADDLLFFRAQRAVRRALLGLAAAWNMDPDDIFYLPLDQVRDHAARGTRLEHADSLAAEARRLRHEQRERVAPLAFRDGRPLAQRPLDTGGLDFWRGRSAGRGSARGSVLRIDDLGRLVEPSGRVVVAQAVTPAAVVQLAGAAALVCEQGGVLDHAAALARELALPCVVGCRGAWHTLATGDEVLVDGDAGLVIRLSPAG